MSNKNFYLQVSKTILIQTAATDAVEAFAEAKQSVEKGEHDVRFTTAPITVHLLFSEPLTK